VQKRLLLVLGDDEAFKLDLASMRAVRTKTKLEFVRVQDADKTKIERQLIRARSGGKPFAYVHIAAHGNQQGVMLGGVLVAWDWLSGVLDGVEVLVLAACESSIIGDWLGVVPFVISISEQVGNENAALFAQAFWTEIGRGWFHFADALAKSYIKRNKGAFVEVVHEFLPEVDDTTGELRGDLSPVTAIYNMDSTKAKWVPGAHGARAWPLRYDGMRWNRFEFFHLVENSGDTDATKRRGECALYRCMEYVRLMGLINAWEQGNLDPDFIDAILLLTGAEEGQFGEAMAAREKAIDEKGNAAKRLAVLANSTEELKAELLFLRRRPENRWKILRPGCGWSMKSTP
jgi:hypothetical protein